MSAPTEQGGRKWRRRFEQLWAKVFGYFWLPCPLCGEMFSGREWECDDFPAIYVHPEEPTRGTGICPRCARLRRRILDFPPLVPEGDTPDE